MFDDLKMIKKFYGEKMMHLCQQLFPTLLEEPQLLYWALSTNFYQSRDLYYDICKFGLIPEFKEYIYTIATEEDPIESIEEKTPQELLEEAGYILYECHNEEEIQTFKKYYKPEEELCTFKGNRLDRCHVFFAVKKNAFELNRESFSKPQRQDEYGTSVISIQFTRGNVNTLSIKNRYNHRVDNCDSTFNNNLDNIKSGLSSSFRRHYKFNFIPNRHFFEIKGYVRANDGKFHKYNYEINNIYYCPGNIIIDNFVVKKDYLDSSKYLIIDYFILDITNKKILLYDSTLKDCFIDDFKNISKINVIKKENNNKVIYIETKKGEEINVIEVIIDKNNNIIGYKNDKLNRTDDFFLYNNVLMTDLNLPMLKEAGNYFLFQNESLTSVNLPSLVEVGDYFFTQNESLITLELPLLKQVGSGFLSSNNQLTEINLPSLKEAGNEFLSGNKSLTSLYLPSLIQVGDNFLSYNNSISVIYLPNLIQFGHQFLSCNNLKNELIGIKK